MKTLLTFLLLSVFVAASQSAMVFSQNPPPKPKPPQDDKIPQLRTYEVRLPVTVKQKGQFLLGLNRSHFEVYEDGKKQKIEDFIAPSELPLNVGLLVDTSNSVKLKMPFEKEAADAFVSTVTSYRRKDQVLLVSFDSDVELHQDFTNSTELLFKAIRKLKAGGYTKMYDAVYRIIEEKMATTAPNSDVRRILVILTDGADTASERSLKEAIEIAQKHDVTVFGISTKNFTGVGSGSVEGEEDKELRRLCEATGGQVFLPSQLIDLHRAFTEVAKDIRQEYVIYYRPENQDPTGKRREIKVKLLNAKGDLFHKEAYTY
jgi:Ca-activated chloride channel homolog